MVDKPEDVWQKAMENALVYGTGFVRFDSMGGISVVDPKDYHYLEKKEWVGLTTAEVIQCQAAYYYDTYANIEAKLKEKNGG
jgi:hypothetical protein